MDLDTPLVVPILDKSPPQQVHKPVRARQDQIRLPVAGDIHHNRMRIRNPGSRDRAALPAGGQLLEQFDLPRRPRREDLDLAEDQSGQVSAYHQIRDAVPIPVEDAGCGDVFSLDVGIPGMEIEGNGDRLPIRLHRATQFQFPLLDGADILIVDGRALWPGRGRLPSLLSPTTAVKSTPRRFAHRKSRATTLLLVCG